MYVGVGKNDGVRPNLEDHIRTLAALADPVRTRIYRHIASQEEDVGRDQVARALRISRSQATFHLEKLVEHGLLETTYRRLSERRGPGAGRTSKLYRRARRQVEVSLPPRNYQLVSEALAVALEKAGTTKPREQLAKVGRKIGRQWAAERPVKQPLKSLESVLSRHGYEPRWEQPNRLRLQNCPFEALVADHEELICKVFNLRLIESLVKGLGAREVAAVYTPPPPLCCISLRVG